MNTQLPKPYIVSVVAFALLIPLWILAAGAKPQPERPAPMPTPTPIPVPPLPPPKPKEKEKEKEKERPVQIQFKNESIYVVNVNVTWQVPNATNDALWDNKSQALTLPLVTGSATILVPSQARRLVVAGSAVAMIPFPGFRTSVSNDVVIENCTATFYVADVGQFSMRTVPKK